MAAPSKLTPTVQDLICEAIAQGNYYEPACALAGIAYFTFNRWMHEGEEAKSGAKREFYEAVTRAEAEAEARVVAFWQAQTPTDWQACRDFLARRHPERWGPRDKHQITGANDGPVQVSQKLDLSTLADDELDLLGRLAARLDGPNAGGTHPAGEGTPPLLGG